MDNYDYLYMQPDSVETIESVKADRDHIWNTLQQVQRENERLKRELAEARRPPTCDWDRGVF